MGSRGRGHRPANALDCSCIGAVRAILSQTGIFLSPGASSS
ncbi:Uncharacterized protein PPKH_2672 [Pseudomonas putida]|nr:Uncharacterized protein PPKH_2672 [Pseudomonas putida]